MFSKGAQLCQISPSYETNSGQRPDMIMQHAKRFPFTQKRKSSSYFDEKGALGQRKIYYGELEQTQQINVEGLKPPDRPEHSCTVQRNKLNWKPNSRLTEPVQTEQNTLLMSGLILHKKQQSGQSVSGDNP